MSVCSNSIMRRTSVRVAMDDMKNDIMNEMGPDLLNGGNGVNEPTRVERLESLLLDVPHTEIAVDQNGVTRKRPRAGDDLQVKLLRTLQILIKRQENEDASERMANEWRHVAQVIDRLLFWIFFVATTIITFVLLVLIPSLPHHTYDDEE
ncbi:hypothetical protein OSTOST_14628 [Ostertagia ostertagi]